MSTPTTNYTVEGFDAAPKAHECPTCGRTHLVERPNETADRTQVRENENACRSSTRAELDDAERPPLQGGE